MNTLFRNYSKTLLPVAFVLALLVGFIYVLMRSGPLAPTGVVMTKVETRQISPALFGIGIVEAEAVHKIGPTLSGRILHLAVQAGDTVEKGQLLGAMDPVDLDDKIHAQAAAVSRAGAAVAAGEAHIREAQARTAFARTQAERYAQLLTVHSVSKEAGESKQQDYHIAEAALAAARANLEVARREVLRLQAEGEGLVRQRDNLRLISPVNGLVTRRDADPGTTVVPGQSVIEVIEPNSVWINVRFDQQRAVGLRAGLRADIVLRSLADKTLAGKVQRLEPLADAVTEEMLAKVRFDLLPHPLPPLGELAEVTVYPETRKAMPAIRNACLQRVDGRLGVWVVADGKRLIFTPVKTGAVDLDGWVEIVSGLEGSEQLVLYSKKPLQSKSRITIEPPDEGKRP